MFRETGEWATPRENGKGFYRNIMAALEITMQAGRWILRTPFALATIVFGMFYDHILRMVITMTSQYLRLIQLPEASFGLISAALSLLGLIVPKWCERMVERNSPQKNVYILLAITVAGLFMMAGFYPYIGLAPISCVYVGIMMVSFFTSHYLNRITSSGQRATVLSFKGMAFNLGYGLIGVLFAILMQQMRGRSATLHPDWSSDLIEQSSFMHSMGWFPWYTLGLFAVILVFCRLRLANMTAHRQRG
jgi:hypothetical protein